MNVRSGVRGVVHEQRAWGLFGVKEVKTPLFVSSCFSLVFSVLVRRREIEREKGQLCEEGGTWWRNL